MASYKPVERQIIVITGATSGIGLATARMAAKRGARLVLVARNQEALAKLADELNAAPGRRRCAVWAAADVADPAQLREVVGVAVEAFGGFDTWVNDAGVSIFGKLCETDIRDQRRLFETNYWGVVYGSLIAADHLRARQRGGVIINLGSEVSDVPLPLQGAYSASKHAVAAFSAALRMELADDGLPVAVSVIKPAGVDTPFLEHAKNVMDVEARLPDPLYPPELVAEAILDAAVDPQREVHVGAASKLASMSARMAPGFTEKLLRTFMPRMQRREDRPLRETHDGTLYRSGSKLDEHQPGQPGTVMPTGAIVGSTRARRMAVGAGVIAAVGAGLVMARSMTTRDRAAKAPTLAAARF
ncbi:SDR family oxidoreductase [Derxia gummosa]|uniref:SDR family oxidoreductase n=1 Tax=Derxia gummosa DSM 723 TaxID=1121388 RepID=A0A8B6X6M7_9BURK|nr:SDR family oxidoreductase [Derxia gummosa]